MQPIRLASGKIDPDVVGPDFPCKVDRCQIRSHRRQKVGPIGPSIFFTEVDLLRIRRDTADDEVLISTES